MINFNSDNIIVGYIKQLLHDFNLPSCFINPEEFKKVPGSTYIEGKNLIQNIAGDIKIIDKYFSGSKLPENLEKHLLIKNKIYDIHTHEYLGEYLRFLRDYEHIDLMPLYNCFSNNIVEISEDLDTDEYNSNEYRTYAVPVKLGKEYTIAIDCSGDVKLFCGYYKNKIYDVNEDSEIQSITKEVKHNTYFNQPFVYSKLVNQEFSNSEILAEENLKLFITLPITNTSSIVVLEGNYITCSLQVVETVNNVPKAYRPKLIYNYENIDSISKQKLALSTKLQLLEYNSKVSHPFSDRLISYLLGNVVSNLDDIPDNKIRVKKALVNSVSGKTVKDNLNYTVKDGQWSNKFNIVINEYMSNRARSTYMDSYNIVDVLGYFDKDIEKYLPEVDLYSDMIWTEGSK